MTEKRFRESISTGTVIDMITGKEYNCKYRINDKLLELINKIAEENKKLKLQNEELLYQIGYVGKNNKTCRECEAFIPEHNICWMWDMEVEADDVVVACDQRKVKNAKEMISDD